MCRKYVAISESFVSFITNITYAGIDAIIALLHFVQPTELHQKRKFFFPGVMGMGIVGHWY